MTASSIEWDFGTAYDFFISLDVLHYPDRFGVRGVWAAGMRSRLPGSDREFLEEIYSSKVIGTPLPWIHRLAPPKDSATALRALDRTPAARRLPELNKYVLDNTAKEPWACVICDVAERGSYADSDIESLREIAKHHEGKLSRHSAERTLYWWTHLEEFGEQYLKALQAYYEVFFAEEERRIYPALQDALEQAQQMSEELPMADLLQELSQGIRFGEAVQAKKLIIAPSFWTSPLIYFGDLAPDTLVFAFGARPADASLVPGEVVPETLLRSLKALSDPTRLKILHYLAGESLTPTQLAHRLRLRAPTVVHHLQALRVAGLVQMSVPEGKERSYSLRAGAVAGACQALQRFLGVDVAAELHRLDQPGD